jgi:hypothetical protein
LAPLPIGYERDDVRKRIRATGQGSFLAEDVLEIFARMRAEGVWGYAVLYDLRRMTGNPSISDVRRILDAAASPEPDGQRPGPIAVVNLDPEMYAKACLYAAMGPPSPFEAFRDLPEAEAWLASHHSP